MRHLEPEPGLILVEYEDVPMTLRERPGRSPELLMWTEAGPRDPFPSATTPAVAEQREADRPRRVESAPLDRRVVPSPLPPPPRSRSQSGLAR